MRRSQTREMGGSDSISRRSFLSAAAGGIGLGLLSDGALAGVDPSTPQQAWSGYRGGPRQNGSTVRTTVDRIEGTRWTVGSDSQRASVPASDGELVYVAAGSRLVAIDYKAGTGTWSSSLSAPPVLSPAVGSGFVFVTTEDGNLAAFDRDSGEQQWRKGIGGRLGAPTVSDGVVYAGNHEGRLLAFEAESGDVVWSRNLDTAILVDDGNVLKRPTPAVTDGTAYVNVSVNNAYASKLVAVNAGDGETEWEYGTSADRIFPPAVNDEYLCVTTPGKIELLSRVGGVAQWTHEPDGYTYGKGPSYPAALGDESVAVVDHPDPVRCKVLEIADGSKRWEYTAGGTVPGGVSLSDDSVHFTAITGGTTAKVLSLGKENGLEEFSRGISNSPVDFGPIPLPGGLIVPDGGKIRYLGDGSEMQENDSGTDDSVTVEVRTDRSSAGPSPRDDSTREGSGSGGIDIVSIASTLVTIAATIVGILQLRS